MHGDTGFVTAGQFNPGMLVEQVGGWGLVAVIVAVVIVVVVVKIVFSILRKVLAVVVTLALTGALGGGVLGMATGWFDKVPEFFGVIFDNMPWS